LALGERHGTERGRLRGASTKVWPKTMGSERNTFCSGKGRGKKGMGQRVNKELVKLLGTQSSELVRSSPEAARSFSDFLPGRRAQYGYIFLGTSPRTTKSSRHQRSDGGTGEYHDMSSIKTVGRRERFHQPEILQACVKELLVGKDRPRTLCTGVSV